MDRNIRYSDVLEKASSSSGVKQKMTVIRNTALELLFDSYIKYYGIDSGIDFDVAYIDEISYISNNNENNDTIVILNLKEISPWIFDNIYVLQDDQIQTESDKIKAYLLPLLNKLKNINAAVLFFNFEKDYFESEFTGTIPINKIINALNVFIEYELEGNQNVYLIDINRVIAQIGAYNFYDKRGYYLNSSLYSKEGCNVLAHESVRKLNVIYGKSKKCIVLDCDNVLWGGAIVDDGIDNIKLGQVYPGNAFQDFQREIIKLCHQGIIICLCSKNNEHDVISVLQNHPDMLLKPEYIAAYKINWNNKADNINELAEELNIGLDSMVFIDDSEYEIALINKELPQIKTIHLNAERPHEFADILNHCGLFEKIHITDEDEKRAGLYIDKSKRNTYKQSFTDLEAYHKSLETILTIKYADNFAIPRLAQLSQRTNQFNMTAKKYSEKDLYSFTNSDIYDVIYLSAQDIFGDMGIVGCAILNYFDKMAVIEALMLSCRVFCRGFEDVLLSQICELAQSKGNFTIIGKYTQTKKNEQFSEFYPNHMFTKNYDTYEKNSNTSITFPNHFKEIRGL